MKGSCWGKEDFRVYGSGFRVYRYGGHGVQEAVVRDLGVERVMGMRELIGRRVPEVLGVCPLGPLCSRL